MSQQLFLDSLREGLHDIFQADDKVVLLGEDILDPYGGAFKVTKGLSTKYPDRVFATPICEASIVGTGVGLTLRGYRAIVEIMFGDFVTIAADQIINHAAKFELMYGEHVKIPLVIRTPMGGGRGYGPTHSQSLEKMFLGIPNLVVVAPSHFHDPGRELKKAVRDDRPVLFVENKLLYSRMLHRGSDTLKVETVSDDGYSVVSVRNYREGQQPDVTLISYGGASRFFEELLEEMADEEIWCEAIFVAGLSEPPVSLLARHIGNSGRVVIAEEGYAGFGWGAELSHQINTALFGRLKAPVLSLGSESAIIPSNFEDEQKMLINKDKIAAAIMEVMEW